MTTHNTEELEHIFQARPGKLPVGGGLRAAPPFTALFWGGAETAPYENYR